METASTVTDEEINLETSLLIREINRMKNFADTSTNAAESYSLINKIEDAFRLNLLKGEEYDGWESYGR